DHLHGGIGLGIAVVDRHTATGAELHAHRSGEVVAFLEFHRFVKSDDGVAVGATYAHFAVGAAGGLARPADADVQFTVADGKAVGAHAGKAVVDLALHGVYSSEDTHQRHDAEGNDGNGQPRA